MNLNERTFGIEIEMCNVDRQKVTLPKGYTWSQDEKIFNTNAKVSKRYGGEVNTPPLHLCQKDRLELKSVYSSLVDAGGKLKWSIDTHVHIYAGDLELEHLKNIFYFLYHCYRYIKQYCHISDWDEKVFNAQPIVTEEHYKKVKSAKTFNELESVFANQSNKHYLRLAINIASVFVRGTIEFRCFHATDNFSLVENCVLASYRMFLYAVSHSEMYFKEISSYNDFIAKVKLPSETPPLLVPLIYQGNPYDPKGCFLAYPIKGNAKLKKILLDQGMKDVCVVGDLDYTFAFSLYKHVNVSVYSQNLLTHLLYLLATGKKVIRYNSELDWLNQYVTEDAIRQVTLAMFVVKIRNYIGLKNDYCVTMLESYKDDISKSISKMEAAANKLVSFFNVIEYHFGTLDDALCEKDSILYQFGHDKHSNSAYHTFKKHSDFDLEVNIKDVDYYDLVERIPENVTFYMFSSSPFLSNMNKVAILYNGGAKNYETTLYTNKKEIITKACLESKQAQVASINIPPSDLVINDASKLRIISIRPSQLFQLQKRFIRKVDKITKSVFSYAVMYDEYTLGGFGFAFPRGEFADLWQLSDFCTNNDIPRLSKFILLCIKSQIVQRDLSRRIGFLCKKVITYVYTSNPVSMKYRGEYKKDKDLSQPMRLAYITELGKYGSNEDILLRYNKILKV